MTNKKTITHLYLKGEYDPYYIPPLTPEMELLGFLFDNKMLGGPIGQNLILHTTEDFIEALETEKLGPRSKDWIFIEDDTIQFQRKRNASDEQISGTAKISSPTSNNEVVRALHNITPLLFCRETRSACLIRESTDGSKFSDWDTQMVYDLWRKYYFEDRINAHTSRVIKKIANKINSSLKNNQCNKQYLEKLFKDLSIEISEKAYERILNLTVSDKNGLNTEPTTGENTTEADAKQQLTNKFLNTLIQGIKKNQEFDYTPIIETILNRYSQSFKAIVLEPIVSEIYDECSKKDKVERHIIETLVYLASIFDDELHRQYAELHITKELGMIHRIMYIQSRTALKIQNIKYASADSDGKNGGEKIALHFTEPDYANLLREGNSTLNGEIEKINSWLDKKDDGKHISYHYELTKAGLNMVSSIKLDDSTSDSNQISLIDHILNKILRLVQTVYANNEFSPAKCLNTGEYYISVCHYCGGLFYRKTPNKIYCEYYKADSSLGEDYPFRDCGKLAIDAQRKTKK